MLAIAGGILLAIFILWLLFTEEGWACLGILIVIALVLALIAAVAAAVFLL